MTPVPIYFVTLYPALGCRSLSLHRHIEYDNYIRVLLFESIQRKKNDDVIWDGCVEFRNLLCALEDSRHGCLMIRLYSEGRDRENIGRYSRVVVRYRRKMESSSTSVHPMAIEY